MRVLPALAGVAMLVVAARAARAWTGYRHDLRQARERAADGSRVVATRFGPIEYAQAGDSAPVLVVHGPAVATTRGWSSAHRWPRRDFA